MSQRLADAAVSGMSTSSKLAEEARKFLDAGDIDGLRELRRSQFGGLVMKLEDDEDDDTDEGDDDGDEGDEDDDDEDEDDSSAKRKRSPESKRIQELVGEAKRYRLKAREHRNRIAELETEVANLKKSKGSKAKDDEDDSDAGESETEAKLQAELDKSTRANEDLLIRLEFMGNTKFSWKNPKAALRLLDLSDVEITDDGEVEGLDEAIEALAKSDPYLLAKGKDDEDEDDEDEDEKPRRKRSTGTPPGSKRTKGNPNRDKLVSKYPALRR